MVVLFSSSIVTPAQAYNEEEAAKAALTAAFKQSGIEDNVNKVIDKAVPETLKVIAERIGPAASMLINKRVDIKWTF